MQSIRQASQSKPTIKLSAFLLRALLYTRQTGVRWRNERELSRFPKGRPRRDCVASWASLASIARGGELGVPFAAVTFNYLQARSEYCDTVICKAWLFSTRGTPFKDIAPERGREENFSSTSRMAEG